jgi:hypothetical protein
MNGRETAVAYGKSFQEGEVMEFEYFPILRWKQGEQTAVARLDAGDRAVTLPVAEVQLLEQGTPQPKLLKTLQKGGADKGPIGIDVRNAYTGPVPLLDLAKLASTLQITGLSAWPVIHASDALLSPQDLPHFKGQPGLILRIYPNQMLLATAIALVSEVRKACGKRTHLYVLLDMDAIGEIDLNALAAMLEPFVRNIAASGEVTQVASVGGSFPYKLTGIKPGVQTRLPRKELDVWKRLRRRPGCDAVMFGDYGVTNPTPLEEIDPRKLNPAAAIRYALKNEWWLLRASGVRTAAGGMGQYNDLCRLLVAHTDYSGAQFSFGDKNYWAHAQPGASSGSFMTWRRDATSHHLVFTARQLVAGDV